MSGRQSNWNRLLVKVIMVSLLDKIHKADKQIDKLSGLLQKLKEANEESKAVTKAFAMKGILHQSRIGS
ncbi:hypothetical protein HN51_040642 [Arachis hypogaea]